MYHSLFSQKDRGYCPIAVGDVLCCLASRICCASIKDCLPVVFVPYGQVGVGLKSGLEAAIHSMRFFIDATFTREDFCCLKIDMTNVFNECFRSAFLECLRKEFS